MTLKLLYDKLNSVYTIVILLVFVVLYQCYFIFYGLDFQDGFYHMNRMIANEPYVMAFLGYKIGHYWYLIFGKSVIGFRVLNVIVYLIALFAPVTLVRDKKKHLLLTFLVSFFFVLLNWDLLGYDSFSMMFMVLTAVFLIRYFQHQYNSDLVGIALFSALAMGARLPNLLIIPAIILILLLYKKSIGIKPLFLYSIMTLLFFLILVLINYGSFNNYVFEINDSFTGTTEDHAVSSLIKGYLTHFVFVLQIVFSIIVFYFVYNHFWKHKWGKIIVIAFCAMLLLVYYKKVFASGFNTKMALFCSSITISLIILEIYNAFKHKRNIKEIIKVALPILLLAFIPCMGSNSGLKYAAFFIVFIPFLVLQFNFNSRKIILFILIALVPFTLIEKYKIKFMDASQNLLTAKYDLKNMKGIYSTPQRVAYINHVLKDYDSIARHQEVVFYGLNSHIFSYLRKNSEFPFKTFAMKLDSPDEKNEINKIIKNKRPAFIITSYDIKDKPSLIEEFVIQNNYKRITKQNYSLLIPN